MAVESDAAAAGSRRIELRDGLLIIRPVDAGDAEGLRALYEDLDLDDRYLRFFSAYRPPASFFERIVTVRDRGGAGLVAVHRTRQGVERLVGEAGFERLANGDGELAITVARDWRGWLGPCLLDALLEAAAAEGVPNLEADVLVRNRAMLALARARGAVTMDHPDWSVVRVLIGATSRAPRWPTGDAPRVLLEGVGGHWRAEEMARREGLAILACEGPTGRRVRCPALAGDPCPLAAEADVIVVCRRTDEAPWRDLLGAHAVLHAGVPLCVDTTAGPADGPDRLPRDPDAAVDTLRTLAATADERATHDERGDPDGAHDGPDRQAR